MERVAIERLARQTMEKIRMAERLKLDSRALRQSAEETRRAATVLCRFSALERTRQKKAPR